MADETPEEPEESLKDFMDKVLGGEKGTDEFFNQLEDPSREAWVGFHELYSSLRSGGFNLHEATDIMAGYLYRLIAGGEQN